MKTKELDEQDNSHRPEDSTAQTVLETFELTQQPCSLWLLISPRSTG
jgi:hypothetical protein